MRLIIAECSTSDGPSMIPTPTGPSWEALETVLRSMYGADVSDDEDDVRRRTAFVCISRLDGGANYRAPGDYAVKTREGRVFTITMEG